MSAIQEDLLGPTITKKRAIAVILVAVLLVALFAYSVMIYGYFFGAPRIPPNERLEGAPEEDALLTLPQSGYNWSDLAEDLDLDDPDLLDQLRDLHDGNIDSMDLLQYAALAAALAGSDIEVFRVYSIESYEDVSDNLWKFECFDEFLGDTWECNVPLQNYNFYPYSDYYSLYSGLNLYNISMPLTPDVGVNSFMIPNLFPNPYIMENSLDVDNINPGSEVLKKNAFNSTTLALDFTSEDPVNMTYELFGLDLPSATEINNSAVDEDYTPSLISNRYLQLPPDIPTYLDENTNPNVNRHYNNLRGIINEADTAFVVANKIRNYLQANFSFGYQAMQNTPPADGEDIVEWFCYHEEGIWTHFAAAFCVFCRAFGVSCRYVNGYNSRFADQVNDPQFGGDGIAIKYKNIYNWAEIYVPTDVSGDGRWVQMDIMYESFGGGGVGPILSEFNITVNSNSTSYSRGDLAQINATLTTNQNISVANRNVQFYDQTMSDLLLGNDTTDQNGLASITIPIDNSMTVGPHIIYATYAGAINGTVFLIDGDIEVGLTSVSPPQVNISQNPYTTITGYVRDPLNGNPVNYANVNFVLFQKDTTNTVLPSFTPLTATTNENGIFSETVQIDSSVPYGQYEVRTDFNGSWTIGFNPSITNSSNRLDLNITKELTYSLWFYINDVPADNDYSPNIGRSSTLQLKAILLNETMEPAIGYSIQFFDYTTNTLIGSNITNSNGITRLSYPLGSSNPAGPNLLYASFSGQQNYSYYILSDTTSLNNVLGPNPLEINTTGSGDTQFNVNGYLNDSAGNPIPYSEINIRIFNGIYDYSSYLIPQQPTQYTNEDGYFDLTFGVESDIPPGNYTLELEFNGYMNLYEDSNNPDPNQFYLSALSDLLPLSNDLKITNPGDIRVYLSVENNPTTEFYTDSYLPEIYTNTTDTAHFQINVTQGGVPTPTGTITLYDLYGGYTLTSYNYDGSENGFIQLNISTSSFLYSGLHKIRAQYDDGPFSSVNYTFIIFDDNPIEFTQLSLSHSQIVRDSTQFDLSGTLEENGFDLRALNISLTLLNQNYQDVSEFLVGNPLYEISNQNGFFDFTDIQITQNCPRGNYFLRIDFNGSILLSEIPGVDVSSFMKNSNSSLIPIDIYAGTDIVENPISTDFDVSNIWVDGDTVYVSGNLYWDNTTGIEDAYVDIEIRDLSGTLVASNYSVQTDSNGFFNASLNVDDTWPDYWSETTIRAIFDPTSLPNTYQYVQATSENY
ncbi:MAG: hypothetical protein GF311_07055 [Candidatus Lokiarchaeota archaeon]|nr:hypothetical protein [Candidatus Lokiarchaeota archaeon]